MRVFLSNLIIAWVLLARPLAALAQPAGCTSTYTSTGTTPGGASGLFAEYYSGTFQAQPGYSESSPNTFFTTTAVGQSGVTGTPINYQSPAAGGYVAFPVNVPPASGSAGTPTTFSARFRGSVYLKAGAPYTFTMQGDDGAYLFLGKEATLANPTPNNAFIKSSGGSATNRFVAPTTGLYDVQLIYGQYSGTSILRLDYAGGPDGLGQQRVALSALCAGPSGIDYTTTNLTPTANNVTNGQLYANGSQAALNAGFSGYDADGTITGYTITSLPAQGQLLYNANATGAANYQPITTPFTLTPANLGRLVYKTPTAASGSFTFQYQAVDNAGASGYLATYTLPVATASADLSSTLASPATAPQGSLVYFTVSFANAGPATVSDAAVTIQLPTGLTGISLSNSGNYNSGTGVASWPTFSISPSGSGTRSIAFTMPGTAVSGTSNITSALFTDPNSSNNQGTAYTGPTQVADVSVAISGPVRVVTSQSITYTVVTTNLGPSAATGVAPAAQLDAGLTGVVVSNGGVYNATNGQVSWPTSTSLGVGAFLAYTVKFNASATAGTSYAGVASASSTTANGDPAATNNDGSTGQAQITTQVISTTAATTECINPEVPDPGYVAVPNSYYPGLGTASAGSNSLSVGPVLNTGSQKAIVPGDLVVIMQMQGAELNTTNTDAYGDGIDNNNAAAGNLQNSNFRAGLYEYAVVSSFAGGTLTLTSNLINTYVSADASSTQGQQRYQVVRVPRNGGLTLTGNVTGPRWNGLTGGVVVLDVSGTLNFNGKNIDMAGRGFRGGAGQQLSGASGIANTAYRHSNTLSTDANKGEGTAGTPRYLNDPDNFAAYRAGTASTPFLDTQASGLLPASLSDGYPGGDRARGAPGNAGGGGTDGTPSDNSQNTGGGGGANAGRGGRGGNGWNSNSPSGGYGGADFTQATPSRLIMGGGGGAGTTNNGTVATPTSTYPGNAGVPGAGSTSADGTPTGGFTSSGSAGGGIVIVRATSVSGAGTIDVSGTDVPFVPNNDGSGGGGAGGSVLLLVNAANGNPNSTVLQNIKVLANGGKGGSNTGGGSPHGPGGGGAGGLIFASSMLASGTASNPSPNGTTFGFESYGSGVGAADQGQSQTGITRADVPNQISGCPADVVTTLSSSASPTNTAAPSTSVTFTLTSTNVGPGTALNVAPALTLVPNLPAAAFTSLGGGSYNPTTGVVTFPVTSQLTSGSTLTYPVTFTMPGQTVIGTGASSSDGDLDPRTANNDGTSPDAQVRVEPIFDIAGRIFDDVNYGGGAGRPYATAEASARNSGVSVGVDGSATGSAGTTVELYDGNGLLAATTTSGPDGLYGFSGIVSSSGTSYTVRVVGATVKSARRPAASGVAPVQTFRATNGTDDTERVGGEAPELLDAPANTGSQPLGDLFVAGTSQPQSVAMVTFGSTPQVTGVDFGFNFSTIVSTRDAGPGSLRQFITNANALPNLTLAQEASSNGGAAPAAGTETSIFMISDGQVHPGLRAGLTNQLTSDGVASIVLNPALSGGLPALTDEHTTITGYTQTSNVGNTNLTADLGSGNPSGGLGTTGTTLDKVTSPEVQLTVNAPGSAGSEIGLTLRGGSQAVTGLAIYGFGRTAGSLTGADLYVTGNAVTGTVISGNVLGTSATSWSDPGSGTRSPGSGIVLGNFSSSAVGAVAATISNNLVGYHGGSGIQNLASGSPTTLLIQDNEIRGNGLADGTAAGLHLGGYGGQVTGNLLVANQGAGLDLQGSAGTATIGGNTVSGNGLAGVATAGIRLDGTANVISQNILRGNAGAGVLGMSSAAVNTISRNSIYGNGTLGIDLMTSGDDPQRGTSTYVTRNASGKTASSGGNGLQNFPILRQVALRSGILYVQGWAPAGSRVELFLADPAASAFGQGRTYLATRTEGATSAAGNSLTAGQDFNTATGGYTGTINGLDQGSESSTNWYEFRITMSQLPSAVQAALNSTSTPAYLTATASRASGSNYATSEFSGNAPVKLNQPLPVVLATFTALAADRAAQLTWTTASEINSAYFTVERSLDGITYAEVSRVGAQGNKQTTTTYAYPDANAASLLPAGQSLYYRLRLTDLDGSYSYSSVRTVSFGPATQLALYPNPATAATLLDLGALPAGEACQVRVFDAVGRLVWATPATGATSLPLPAQQWATGIYLVQVSTKNSNQTLRLVRE